MSNVNASASATVVSAFPPIPCKQHANRATQYRFGRDESGNVGMVFALLIPVIMATAGVAVDYGRAEKLKTQLKQAADASVLAATVSSGKGGTENDAIAAANTVWAANVAGTEGTSMQPKFSVANSGTAVKADITYTGGMNTTFAKFVGVNSIDLSGVSSTSAVITTTTTKKYSGNGGAYGDPHLIGADGYDARFACPNPYWYNMLSDGGVELNVSCYHLSQGPYTGTDIISDETLMLGKHTISLHQGAPNPDFTWPTARMWLGKVTIDGTDYEPSSTAVLATWPEGVVTADIGDGGDPANQSLDNITITTPQFTIILGFEHNNGGVINISANNAGVCGIPGGLWGQTLAGIDDRKIGDDGSVDATSFALDAETATSPEFNRKPCLLETVSNVKITK